MQVVDRLRAYLGERIPANGADTDTMFADDEIQDLLLNFQAPLSGNEGVYLAAAEGWERKASNYADQADHEQGGAKDALSQLRSAAVSEADRFRKLAYGRFTPKVGRIVRPGTTAT
jgi:hypothetical protein